MRKLKYLLLALLILGGCKQVNLNELKMNNNHNTNQVASAEEKVAPGQMLNAHIDRVVDGDTMKVSIGKSKDTIRLLLVDTPETKKPNTPIQPFGPEASAYAKKILDGKDVKLEIDKSERDKYGRLLVYLWCDDGTMFNELLLKKGLARVAYVYKPNVKYEKQYRKSEAIAKKSGIGIWSLKDYVKDDGFHPKVAA